MSGPSVAIRLAGNRVIEGFRSLAGTTDPTTAAPGTIRGDFGRDWGLKVQQNLVHGSDSPESAARELEIWFLSAGTADRRGLRSAEQRRQMLTSTSSRSWASTAMIA